MDARFYDLAAGEVVSATTVECLSCGERRRAPSGHGGRVLAGACPGCGDLGWAGPDELDERQRSLLHTSRHPRPFAA